MKIKIRKYYSGKASKDFWDAVKIIKNESDRQEIYSLGVALQNLEEYVIKRFEDMLEE